MPTLLPGHEKWTGLGGSNGMELWGGRVGFAPRLKWLGWEVHSRALGGSWLPPHRTKYSTVMGEGGCAITYVYGSHVR